MSADPSEPWQGTKQPVKSPASGRRPRAHDPASQAHLQPPAEQQLGQSAVPAAKVQHAVARVRIGRHAEAAAIDAWEAAAGRLRAEVGRGSVVWCDACDACLCGRPSTGPQQHAAPARLTAPTQHSSLTHHHPSTTTTAPHTCTAPVSNNAARKSSPSGGAPAGPSWNTPATASSSSSSHVLLLRLSVRSP